MKIQILTDLEIASKDDLYKIGHIISDIKEVNCSEIGRRLGVDRRTVKRNILGDVKKTREKPSMFDDYIDLIINVLTNETKVFVSKASLFRYLQEHYHIPGKYHNFCRFLDSNEMIMPYVKCIDRKNYNERKSAMRFETSPGEQAQVDWKENVSIVLNNGTKIVINILVTTLSYSRFKLAKVCVSKDRETVMECLTEFFKELGGVPKTIVFDNMKSVMDSPRTINSEGKVNAQFKQFSEDMGFNVFTCMAGRPETKAKVESPMRILNDIKAYNGDLTLKQLSEKIYFIMNRENTSYHQSYGWVPMEMFQKEKDSLNRLPRESLLNKYQTTKSRVKVDKSSFITYKQNKYSVPPCFIGKNLDLRVIDNTIHLYYTSLLVRKHKISNIKINMNLDDQKEITKMTFKNKTSDEIEETAIKNLKLLEEIYDK